MSARGTRSKLNSLTMNNSKSLVLPIGGMDCAGCAEHVKSALCRVPGVESVEVLLGAEKAVLQVDPGRVDRAALRQAVQEAGYTIREEIGPPGDRERAAEGTGAGAMAEAGPHFTQAVLRFMGLVFGAVLFVVVVGEWLGLFELLTGRVPGSAGLAVVLVAGYPVFRNVWRAARRGRATAHTLMTLGVVAALVVGEWPTAVVVVFFMRIGDHVEKFTAASARQAVKELTALAPQSARLERAGVEVKVPLSEVRPGDVVIVRPGEKIPVDGEIIAGQATVDQSAITGESMPVEVSSGATVYAATLAHLGSLRVRAVHIGADTTFGRVIKLVEEAETHRGEVQRFADKFTAYYLPIVATIAALTFIVRRDPLATAAVLLVACSCAIALATPIAMLASIGAAARRGLMVKGGKYLEVLAQADVLLLDKTGTLTLGRPQLTDIVSLNGLSENELLSLAASAERYSEHPLAEAVRAAARRRHLPLQEPLSFEAIPGMGVRAQVSGHALAIGNHRLLATTPEPAEAAAFEAHGKTVLYVTDSTGIIGMMAIADTLRPEVPQAIEQVRSLDIRRIELLTGDNERVAASLAAQLQVPYRANLLPQDKIDIVKAYQAQGHKVIMVGDGVNDAPALAQADVGIVMGAAGSDVALEAAHVALMRDDWLLVPELFRLARRTMRVVKANLGFTVAFNLVGVTLAALGFLPPILAAAAQSLPDLGILANSSRLLRK
jgi:P-type Cu+ transporter